MNEEIPLETLKKYILDVIFFIILTIFFQKNNDCFRIIQTVI